MEIKGFIYFVKCLTIIVLMFWHQFRYSTSMKNALLAIFFLIPALIFSATRISTGNGNWDNAASWSGNAVPTCNDSIVIRAGHQITVANQQNYNCGSRMVILVQGRLHFIAGKKLSLPCGSDIYVMGGATITSDGGGNSNTIEICGTVYWSSSYGNLSGPVCLPANAPDCGRVMPVELISFAAEACGGQICVSWTTATEKNNAFFVLEKMNNNSEFVAIATIPSQGKNGNSRINLSYTSADVSPDAGLNYYRLKQVDHDSTFAYSPIAVFNKEMNALSLNVYPNPNNGEFSVNVSGTPSSAVLVIKNSFGETIQESMISGTTQVKLDGVMPGVYFCMVNVNGEVISQRVVIR